jgi:hypothetical protein
MGTKLALSHLSMTSSDIWTANLRGRQGRSTGRGGGSVDCARGERGEASKHHNYHLVSRRNRTHEL